MLDDWNVALFTKALTAIRAGDFDDIYKSLVDLGFTVRQVGDPNHFVYFHSRLQEDKHFAYARNLYRPHGKNRDGGRIGKRDQSKAKQVVEALRVLLESTKEGAGER